MKKWILLIIISGFWAGVTSAQEGNYSGINKLIITGEYKKAIDTCRLILATDSANAEVWYKMGLASQNMTPDTGSFTCFLKAMQYDPGKNLYRFTVAKGYTGKNKNYKARPLFEELCANDTMNWTYAWHLTNIYIPEGRYNECINIYNRFLEYDSTNYAIYDKLGYAYLKKGEYQTAIDYYNKSMELNSKNIDAIRNLSFLYPFVNNTDTALYLLTNAISMEPDDVDLLARRATINFSRNYTKRALNDYLKILSLGDSSALYLKRAGIGYFNNLQPSRALPYLLKAYARDTSDFENLDYIGQTYYRMNEHAQSANWYNKLITLLKEFQAPLAMAYLSLSREQKALNQYHNAIGSFNSAYKIAEFPYILIYIANIYDENLKDSVMAVRYYNQFLEIFKGKKLSDGGMYSASYVASIQARVNYLESAIAEEKARKAYESGKGKPDQSSK